MDTRQIIIEAGHAVIRERSFHNVTVQDILDQAHVSRRTFYRYFKDKYELMNLYFEEHVTNNVLQRYDGHNWRVLHTEIIDFVMQNREYFLNAFTYSGQNSFWDFLYTYTTNFYTRVALHNQKRNQSTEEEKFKIDFVAFGSIAILRKMIQEGYDLSAKEYSDLICDMIPKEFYTYLDRMDDGSKEIS